MPLKAFDVPKYARIVTALQQRIGDGTYPLGAMVPSEAALAAEFGASRPVVVRALGILEQDGWLIAEHGRGRFVRRTHPHQARQAGAGRDLLTAEDSPQGRLLEVAVLAAPTRAGHALGVAEGSPLLTRRWLVTSAGGPLRLCALYLPVALAEGTELTQPKPLRTDVLTHLRQRAGLRLDYATDRIGARAATAEESRLLQIARREPVLTVLVTAHDRDGKPRLLIDAVIAATRAELEDAFPLT